MERRGIEPRSAACDTAVFPLDDRPQSPRERAEARSRPGGNRTPAQECWNLRGRHDSPTYIVPLSSRTLDARLQTLDLSVETDGNRTRIPGVQDQCPPVGRQPHWCTEGESNPQATKASGSRPGVVAISPSVHESEWAESNRRDLGPQPSASTARLHSVKWNRRDSNPHDLRSQRSARPIEHRSRVRTKRDDGVSGEVPYRWATRRAGHTRRGFHSNQRQPMYSPRHSSRSGWRESNPLEPEWRSGARPMSHTRK